MKVSVPKETGAGERRVALVPDVVKRLGAKQVEVAIERGAGEAAMIPDAAFEEVKGMDAILLGAIGDPRAPVELTS